MKEETGYCCRLLRIMTSSHSTSVTETGASFFHLQIRHFGAGDIKLIWWFIAAIDEDVAPDFERPGEEQFEVEFFGYEAAVEKLTFRNDQEMVKRAIVAVRAAHHWIKWAWFKIYNICLCISEQLRETFLARARYLPSPIRPKRATVCPKTSQSPWPAKARRSPQHYEKGRHTSRSKCESRKRTRTMHSPAVGGAFLDQDQFFVHAKGEGDQKPAVWHSRPSDWDGVRRHWSWY